MILVFVCDAVQRELNRGKRDDFKAICSNWRRNQTKLTFQ